MTDTRTIHFFHDRIYRYPMLHEKELREKCTVPVMAEVVDIRSKTETHRDNDGHHRTTTSYTPVYRFALENDVEHEAVTSYWDTSSVSNIGEKVEILVDPDDPDNIWDSINKPMEGFVLIMTCIPL